MVVKNQSKSLVELVREQIVEWIYSPPSPVGQRQWIQANEGKVYLRYNSGLNRMDLASIELVPDFQRQGISKQILTEMCRTHIRTVLVENIMVPGWATKLAALSFPARKTVLRDLLDGKLFNVEYILGVQE